MLYHFMFHPDTKIHMQGFLYLFSRTFVDTLQYSLWTVKIFHALWLQQVFCKSCSWLYLLKPVFDRLTAIWNLYLTQMLHLTVEWFWKLTNNLNLFKHPWLFFFPWRAKRALQIFRAWWLLTLYSRSTWWCHKKSNTYLVQVSDLYSFLL